MVPPVETEAPILWGQQGSHRAVRYQLSAAGSFTGKSGCAVKLFCSSARGIAVNPLHQKSASSFLSTEVQLLSSSPLKCWVGTFGVPRSQAGVGKQGGPQDTPMFYRSLGTLQPDTLVPNSSWGRVIPHSTEHGK